jgi:hypothetical protein
MTSEKHEKNFSVVRHTQVLGIQARKHSHVPTIKARELSYTNTLLIFLK